jgi:hypothetical protein
MASYNPPSEDLPIFDNSVFVATNTTTLTRVEANSLYLKKTFADTCTALETFSAGINATFIDVTGTLTSATSIVYSYLTSPLIYSNEYQITDPSLNCDFCNNQVSGILNIATNARTGNINFGTQQTNNQLTIGSSLNTQTNISGGAIGLFGDTSIGGNTDISGDLIVTGTVTSDSLTTNTINTKLQSDTINICTDVARTGRISIGGSTTNNTSGIYIGGTNNPVVFNGSCNFTSGLTSSAPLVISNASYILPPTTPPTLPINSLGYYYNYPVVNYNSLTTTGYRFNPTTNTNGALNYLYAGVYTANLNTVVRYTGSPSAVTYIYNIGIASGVTTGTVTTSTVTNISPVSPDVRGSLFSSGNNIDFGHSHTLCFTITSNSFVNLFVNVSTLTVTGGSINIALLGCITRIA